MGEHLFIYLFIFKAVTLKKKNYSFRMYSTLLYSYLYTQGEDYAETECIIFLRLNHYKHVEQPKMFFWSCKTSEYLGRSVFIALGAFVAFSGL